MSREIRKKAISTSREVFKQSFRCRGRGLFSASRSIRDILSIRYRELSVTTGRVRIVAESARRTEVIFLEEHNRLSSRDSGDIENNMATFYHW